MTPAVTPSVERRALGITIGGVSIAVRTADTGFRRLLERRYAGFTQALPARGPDYTFDVDLIPQGATVSADADLHVSRNGTMWEMRRGDFFATWDPTTGTGHIRQSVNPYSIDSVLRIVHTLTLAQRGGFLLHAGSAVRNGRAFMFSGVSGAGKTTITRLAPADATLLTDEISYMRREGNGYCAYGTPFAGELAKSGEPVKAPVGAVYLLRQGLENRIDPLPQAEAVQALMRNVLFFAHDPELVWCVFNNVCDVAARVPVHRLTFLPDARVWELIQ